MPSICMNRLTVLGSRNKVTRFVHWDWESPMGAQFLEPEELMATRRTWTFQSIAPPLDGLGKISARWSTLTFLLDYEWENKRVKGIAKARAGKLDTYQVGY